MLLINEEYGKTILQHINGATSSIVFTLFNDSFYSKNNNGIFDRYLLAINQAKKRGVDIKILCNSVEQYEKLRRFSLSVRKAKGFKTMHAKVFVFDEKKIVIGSHNMTDNAVTVNLEISVILDDVETIQRFLKYFNIIWSS